jgi:hypothetical protein
MNSQDLIRVERAASRLDTSSKFVWQRLKDGTLTRYRMGNKTYVDIAEVLALRAARSAITASHGGDAENENIS